MQWKTFVPCTLRATAVVLFAIAANAQALDSSDRMEAEERNRPHGECRVEWHGAGTGVTYRAISCLGDSSDVDLHVFRLDLRKVNMDIAWIRGGGSAQRVARDQDAILAMNANFFDRGRQPLGLMVRSGIPVFLYVTPR